jgi:3-phosphoshikimate 1-carboxyvinyltransferase
MRVNMDEARLIGRFRGGMLTPPPSKSLSHRAVICAALAASGTNGGMSEIQNFGASLDLDATIGGIRELCGAQTTLDGSTLLVGSIPVYMRELGHAVCSVDCNESGSTLRFLLPIAALDGRETIFTGRGRLMRRPLDAYADVFRQAGAEFAQGSDAVAISGSLRPGSYTLPGDVSSQFVSGLLLALPRADAESEIRLTTPLESRQYVDMTMDVMAHFGVEATGDGAVYRVPGRQRYLPSVYRVEPDYSQAAFFLVAAAIGGGVSVAGLDPASVQGDREILSVLERAGATVEWRGGVVRVSADHLSAVTVDARETPDLVPPIAVLCCFCEGVSHIINASRLRMKESDRLSAISSELRKLGAHVEESADSLAITGSQTLKGAAVDSWGDHRIAMAMAVASIRCDGPVLLTGWRAVYKSYPGFWRDFDGGGS